MRNVTVVAALSAASLLLVGCGGSGDSNQQASAPEMPGQSVNATDGVNASTDASGTTGSTTGDAGGALNVAGDAKCDSKEANLSGANAQ